MLIENGHVHIIKKRKENTMDLDEIRKRYQEMHAYYEEEVSKKKNLEEIKERENSKKVELEKRVDSIVAKKKALELATERARENSKILMENIMTEVLQMAFNDKKKVAIGITTRDGTPAANLSVITEYDAEDYFESSPTSGSGGVRDMLSVAALTSMQMLEKKNNNAPTFLDEPFKNVSREYADKTAVAMKKLVDYSGRQFFVVTHERDVMPNIADKTFLISKNHEEISKVEELKKTS